MIEPYRIAAIIPSYKVVKKIDLVIDKLIHFVDHILVVDDKCPDGSGKYVEEQFSSLIESGKLKVIYNEKNLGVGGAVQEGFRYCIKENFDFVIKIDGDDQMDSQYIPDLISYLIEYNADFSKGTRFHLVEHMMKMPKLRLFGNLGINFLNKIASGYYHVTDPTNGFFCIRNRVLKNLNFHNLSNNFFFESDLLFRLYLLDAKVVEVPMPSIYGDEESNLSELNSIPLFLKGMFRNFIKRIIYIYFLRDFGFPTVMLLSSIPLLIFGIIFGCYHWRYTEGFASSGTVMLSALPVLLGFQLFLSFLNEDMRRSRK